MKEDISHDKKKNISLSENKRDQLHMPDSAEEFQESGLQKHLFSWTSQYRKSIHDISYLSPIL